MAFVDKQDRISNPEIAVFGVVRFHLHGPIPELK
jgi:hypothetical protein